MTTRYSARLAFLVALASAPVMTGCDVDNHDTATGSRKSSGLEPNKPGPEGSGSIDNHTENSGGRGAPGTTAENPEKK